MLDIVRLLVHLGLQSLRAHKTKTFIVGGLMMFGAFVVVVSLALVDSIERSTRASIVQSIAGDIQVYSAKAEDKFALFGGIGFGSEDLGEIESFAKVRDALTPIDNVAGVVPMGIANAAVSSPGDLDRTLNALRAAVRAGDAAESAGLVSRIRAIATVLHEQQEKEASVNTSAANGKGREVLEEVTSDAFWSNFDDDPITKLNWLDTRLAPLGEQGNQFYLRLVGTDLEAFKSTFARTKIVEGEPVPPGTRGLLVGKSFLDRRLKMAVAMNLDMVHNDRAKGALIAETKVLQETLAKARRASSRIVYMLPPKELPTVDSALATELDIDLATKTTSTADLLLAFLDMNDENFERRYQLFYDVIAPKIQLYPFQVGDTITLSSFSKSGYLRSMNVKVYGIYTIDGLESSEIAGALSLTDLVTFRELYGQRTAALDAELAKMKEESGAGDIDRASAEDALFGDVEAVTADVVEASENTAKIEKVERKEILTFDQAEVNKGMVISTAILLKDPSKARQTLAKVQEVVEPMGLQAVDWQEATGIIGQITLVVRAVLLTAIAILFLVTIVILNNALVMATLERVGEFGTLRAIGANKRFVNAMVIFETAVLGTVAAALGAGLGIGLIAYLGHVGIPAPADILQVIFGGPRLFPTVTVGNVVAGLLATLVVAVFATLYPARLAVGVQPVVAMQGKE